MKHTFLYTFMESVSHWKSQHISIIKHHQENKRIFLKLVVFFEHFEHPAVFFEEVG